MHALLHALIGLQLSCAAHSLTFQSEEIAVNFDDKRIRRSDPAAPKVNEVGVYGRLQWDGFTTDKPRMKKSAKQFTGIGLQSGPHYARGKVDDYGGLPRISTNYFGSNVAFFDLEHFWWGCTTTEHLPEWCTLEILGYAHQDDRVPIARAVSAFIPKDDALSMPMLEVILPPSFTTISRVEFNIIATQPLFYLDNVKYRTTNVTDASGGLKTVVHGHETSQSEFQMRLASSEKSL